MNKNVKVIIGAIAVVVASGGIYALMNNKNDARMADEKNIQQVVDSEDAMGGGNGVIVKDEISEDESIIIKNETRTLDNGDAMMKTGSYEAYSTDKLARAEAGDVILFFHASWCPSCRGLNSSIESNFKSIPEGVTILKTDYDEETELKKKYGVTYQHTLVQVDKYGNMIKKWSGSPSLDSLLSQIQ